MFVAASLISGTLWGLTGFVFIKEGHLTLLDSVLYHGLLLLFITALIAGSVVTYSASRLVYLSFSVPAVMPQCFLLISYGDKYHSFLGGVVLAYTCVMFLYLFIFIGFFQKTVRLKSEMNTWKLFLKKTILS